MKKRNFVLALLACFTSGSLLGGLFSVANADETTLPMREITFKLNGGFRVEEYATGETETQYSEEDVIVNMQEGRITFTHDVVRNLFGNKPVYSKATETNTTGFESTSEGYYHAPTTKAWSSTENAFTDLLFGVFEDSDEDGVLDDGEKLYRSGDVLDVSGDMTLTCYYEGQNVYTDNGREKDKNAYVALKKAWKGDLTNTLEYYSESDLQPFYHTLVEVGSYGFSVGPYTGIIRGVELPTTVEKIGTYAFACTTRLEYVKGTENVKTYDDFAFWGAGLDVKSNFRLEVAGPNNDIAPSAFKFMKANVETRILFTGKNYDYEVGTSWRGKQLQYVDAGAEGVNFDDPCLYVYVPYGKTEDMYISETNFADSSLQAKYTEEVNGEVKCNRVNTPVREMYTVSFDLAGGNINGETSLKNTYMDARAVSVTRANSEANLTVKNEAGHLIRSYNPAEQTLSLLPAEKPTDPTKEGYVFGGWKDQNGRVWTSEDWANGGYAYNYGADGVKLTAVWSSFVSVTYKYNNGQNDLVVNAFEGALLEKPVNPDNLTHYTFTGWYEDDALTSLWDFEKMTLKDNLVLYAGWQASAYKASLFVGEGELTTGEGITQKDEGVFEMLFEYNVSYPLPIPTLDGYTFDGWYNNRNYTGDALKDITVGVYGNPKYYAKWSKNTTQSKIIYVLDGGVNGNNPEVYTEGEELVLEDASKENFLFQGWYLEDNFSEESRITKISATDTGAITLYAKFVEKVSSDSNVSGSSDDNVSDSINDSADENDTPTTSKKKGGCKSTLEGASFSMIGLGLLGSYFLQKKKTKKTDIKNDEKIETPLRIRCRVGDFCKFGGVIMLKLKRVKSFFIVLCTIFFCISSFCGVVSWKSPAFAQETKKATAYFLGEDRETKGVWYTGEKGTKEFAHNRVYGKSGAVLVYHGQVTDGNSVLQKENREDPYQDNHKTFQGEKSAHYVEYPNWIDHIGFQGSGGMWNNAQLTMENIIRETVQGYWGDGYTKQLLYIDFEDKNNPQKLIGSPCLFFEGPIDYSFSVTDENWHVVTAYIGSAYQFQSSLYAETDLSVCDTYGNVLFTERIKNVNEGVYVSFAVQGDFTLRLDTAGYAKGAIMGIFFDEISYNSEIGTSGLTASLEGAKNVMLTWENKSPESLTNVYRRKKGNALFEYVATVGEEINSYKDETTQVATEYEYTLVSGERREYSEDRSWDYYGYAMTGYPAWEHGLGVNDFNEINENYIVSCTTAPYKLTYIEYLENNIGCEIGETIYTEVCVYKNTIYDENGNLLSKGEPYAGRKVSFVLNGKKVYNNMNGMQIPNMKTEIYSCITDQNGKALLVYTPDYVGEYTVVAKIDEMPDEKDIMQGFDKYSVATDVVVYKEGENNAPYLFEITDAIKPGDSFSITGNFIGEGGETMVAYAPYDGFFEREFSEDIDGLKYLAQKDIIVEDLTFNTGLILVFPETEKAGVYNFWVKNRYGWSNSVVMNGVRALYMNQDGAYAGMPIEIVGRNFFGSEYGVDKSYDYESSVKLERIGNIYGKDDGNSAEYVIAVEHGVKYEATQTFLGEEIAKSNPFRVEFVVPDYVKTGTYNVYVTSDGVGYSLLESPQKLVVYEKNTPSYDEKYFGENTHIGNDPLDLKVYWAQYFQYDNVREILSKYYSATDDYEGWGGDSLLQEATQYIQQTIDDLEKVGGGVVYLPNGYYWLTSIRLKPYVILVGESTENTVINIHFPKGTNPNVPSTFQTGNDKISHSGVARFTITLHDKENGFLPDGIFWVNCDYFFVSEIYGDFPQRSSSRSWEGGYINQRGMGYYTGAYNVIQNSKWISTATMVYCSENSSYNIIRNVDLNLWNPMCHLGTKYSFLENTSCVGNGNEGHGWSGRNNAYCAYNYVDGIGETYGAVNKGEIFFFEPPQSVKSIGSILSADKRSFTAYTKNGDIITADTELGYNQCAIQIIDGKGVGQLRYFDINPIPATDGTVYGNTYKLCDWEKDWDVIPDHTSQFSIFEPMTGQTIYNNVARNCAKSLMLFSQCSDSVIYGNRLYNTEGIQVWNDSSSSSMATNMYIRIENNVIDGVSSGTGNGGLEVLSNNGAGYQGLGDLGVLIRGNKLYNLRNYEGYNGSSEFTNVHGINLNTNENETLSVPGSIRFVIVEDNYVENCDYGVRTDARMYGVFLKDNTFKLIGVDAEDMPSNYDPKGGIATENITVFNTVELHVLNQLTFIVDGKEDKSLSRKYTYKEELPILSGAFLGWAKTESVSNSSQIIAMNDGGIATLYAIYGYNISMRYNYERPDGKVEYRNYTILEGEKISLGRPVRIGYTFGGWYYEESCVNAYDETVEITDDLILYAKWISDEEPTRPPQQNSDKDNAGLIVGISIGGILIFGGGIGGVLAIVHISKRKRK